MRSSVWQWFLLVVSTSEKNGKKAIDFLLLYFGDIRKKGDWMKTSSYYRRRSYAFVCINSARNSAVSTQFAKVLCAKQIHWSNDKTIIELGSRKIIDLLAADKSRYFAKPRPITVNSHVIRVQYLSVQYYTRYISAQRKINITPWASHNN